MSPRPLRRYGSGKRQPGRSAGRRLDRTARLCDYLRGGRDQESRVVRPPVRVGVVDIGTNSVRLLITDGESEAVRRVVVTGLGRGVDSTGHLDSDRMEKTVAVLAEYGAEMSGHQVSRPRAVATSATRDAANRETFLDRAEAALGVRPETISGEKEAELSYRGATDGVPFHEPVVVVDIGGGSTEIVTTSGGVSVDIGSVRLTDRVLGTERPVAPDLMAEAMAVADALLAKADPGITAGSVVGVAGTWTSLLAFDLPVYDSEKVHLAKLTRERLDDLVADLAAKNITEVAAIPSLDPGRAPVILGGAVVAGRVMELLDINEVVISERDLLDGLAASLLVQGGYA
ncbi:MAG: exopolyphosphatase [Acidimicrobiia bacterium]|nr:exopolyphosphatase [Acidimicrobiia bacterium]